eukprot:jgi/Picsp_1/4726/NSC_02095-R1_inositol-pentakisphosphate 2-kinase-like
MPGLSLVARFSLNKSGRYDWCDFDSLEESIWTKYDLTVEWNAKNRAAAEIEYVDKILSPLLGSKYVPPQIVTELRHENAVQSVIIMPDATLLPGVAPGSSVAFEIKPKFGHIQQCDTVPKEHRKLKHTLSRYQLHQHVKVQDGFVSEKSGYDPLDLFSGDRDRVRTSVSNLFESPQNNFVIFINGERRHDSQSRISNQVWNDVSRILFLDNAASSESEIKQCISDLLSLILSKEDILQNILMAQKMCSFDVQAIEKVAMGLAQPGYQTEIFQSLSDNPHDKALMNLLSKSKSEKLDELANYCISATAKDCAIIISLEKTDEDFAEESLQGEAICSLGRCALGSKLFNYKITTVDLDRKRLSKIKKHADLDRRIVHAHQVYKE